MKLSQLIAALPAFDGAPPSDPDITLITTDSRQVIPGALFVAHPGVAVNGHRFIPQALKRGAVAIMGEREIADIIPHSAFPLPNYLRVRDGREAFAWLNAAWHDFPARR